MSNRPEEALAGWLLTSRVSLFRPEHWAISDAQWPQVLECAQNVFGILRQTLVISTCKQHGKMLLEKQCENFNQYVILSSKMDCSKITQIEYG